MTDIAPQFIIQQAALTHKLVKKIDSQLTVHGISFTEYMIMHYLDAAPQQTMRRIDLAEAVGISASGVTRLLAPMEKVKLVEKQANPRDARVSLVKLSEPGKIIFSDATESFRQTAASVTGRLTSGQLQKISNWTAQLVS